MANFTDAISQFNPYVEQLPVDEMAKVGIYKQAKYDEGVQKIQSQIDKISGLSVLHPEDKLYIQSKINEVTDKLKRFSTADFSNQQIVSSVSGMTSRLLNDKNILSAVETTANLKKQKEYQEKAISENKSSPSNDAYFEDGIEKYLQTKDPVKRNAFKNFKYVPYTDLSKKWTELIKSINPNATKEDIGKAEDFIDKDGKFQSGKIYEVMTRISKEGVSMEQIENAIRATLTDNDLLQLKIDANYRFRGIDSEKMKNHLKGDYDEKLKTIDGLEKSLNQYKETVKNNPDQVVATDKSLDKLKEKKNKLKSEYEENLSLANTDLESLKTNIYKEGTIFSFANSFSWEKKAKELLENAYLNADIKLKTYDLNVKQFEQKEANDAWNRKFNEMVSNRDYDLKVADQQMENMKITGQAGGFSVYLGASTDSRFDPIVSKNEEIASAQLQIQRLKGELGDNNIATSNVLIQKYKADPKSVTAKQAELIKQIIELNKQAEYTKIELNKAEADVLKNNPNLKESVNKVNDILKTQKPLILQTKSGEKYYFTPNQLLQFSRKMDDIDQMAYLGNFITPQAQEEYTMQKLSPDEQRLHKASYGKFGNVIQDVLKFYSKLSREDKLANDDFQKELTKQLLKNDPNYIAKASEISLPTQESRAYWKSMAASALKKYNFEPFGIKGGSVYADNEKIQKAQEWLAGENSDKVGYSRVIYDNKQYLDIHLGKESVLVPLDATQIRQLPVIQGQPNSIVDEIDKLQYKSGRNSTNPTGNVDLAYYQPWDMNIKGMNVYADLSKNSTSSNQFVDITLIVDGTPYPIQLDQSFGTITGADKFVKSLTNEDIKTFYLKSPNISQQTKEKIKNL